MTQGNSNIKLENY